jgi:uncharacterized protein YnzC (UPF0291/DUF896 family)
MITKEMLDRINYLSKKKRSEGLNDCEIKEQHDLYKKYLAAIRAQVSQQLQNIKFVDKN